MEKETDSKYTGDIYIATCYISHLKRLALKFAQVAVEVANPEFRSFLENCFLKMNRYAYSVWQYVVKKSIRLNMYMKRRSLHKKLRRKDRRLSFYFVEKK